MARRAQTPSSEGARQRQLAPNVAIVRINRLSFTGRYDLLSSNLPFFNWDHSSATRRNRAYDEEAGSKEEGSEFPRSNYGNLHYLKKELKNKNGRRKFSNETQRIREEEKEKMASKRDKKSEETGVQVETMRMTMISRRWTMEGRRNDPDNGDADDNNINNNNTIWYNIIIIIIIILIINNNNPYRLYQWRLFNDYR